MRLQPRADGAVHRPVRDRRRRRELPRVCDEWLERSSSGRRPSTRRWPRWPVGCRTSTCRGSISRERRRRPASMRPTARGLARDDRAGGGRGPRRACRCPPRRWCRTSNACRTGSPSRSCGAAPGGAASARARRSSGRLRFRSVETIVEAALRVVSQHGLQRDLAAVAFDQRLSALRGTGRRLQESSAAGREHLGAQPAGERAAARDRASC